MCLEIIYLMYTHKNDLALNNQQLLICHKTKPNQTFTPWARSRINTKDLLK